MIAPGTLVLLHLRSPTEKFWGVLEEMNELGVMIRGLSVETFDDWMSEVASGEEPSLGLARMFLPMARIERIFVDEQVGSVESYCQRFENRVGTSVESFLGLTG